MNYPQLFSKHKEQTISGRYICLKHIEPLLLKLPVEITGKSVLGKPIYKYQIGTGEQRVLMWSQMHGNESTTTKALFDFFNFLHSKDKVAKDFLNQFTFGILPMLNPDGAEKYTRENANGIDLNRDAKHLSQPESIVLRKVFEEFKPHFCYNLHDQRTIYGVGDTAKSATVSFLAPSYNQERSINDVRAKAMNIIVAMNNLLQEFIPGQVGRFDDGFNINCVGDYFTSQDVPTILFEAGHYPDDYEREKTRELIFYSLVSGLKHICENDIIVSKIDNYLKIPQNRVSFFDFIYRNVKINFESPEKNINFAAQFEEILQEDKIMFEAKISQIGELEHFFGHKEIDAKSEAFINEKFKMPIINEKADFCLGKNIKIVNGLNIS